MALNLKNADVERLTSEVARLTGESKTEAIRRALEERRQRLKAPSRARRRARVLAFRRELDGLMRELGVTIVPFGEAEWQRAVDATNRYGRGRHAAH